MESPVYPPNHYSLPTEDEIEQEANRPQSWPLSILRIAHSEKPKFTRMSLMFFLIAYIYSVLRDTKDAVVMERQEPASISFLKMLFVTPFSFIGVFLIQKFIMDTNVSYVLRKIILFFGIYFLCYSLILLPFQKLIEPNFFWAKDIFGDGRMSFRGMQSVLAFMLTLNFWTSSLLYVTAELWGNLVLSLLFMSFANDVCSFKQSLRFVPMFYIISNFGLFLSGLTMLLFYLIQERASYAVNKFVINSIFALGGVVCMGIYFIQRDLEKNVLHVPIFRKEEEDEENEEDSKNLVSNEERNVNKNIVNNNTGDKNVRDYLNEGNNDSGNINRNEDFNRVDNNKNNLVNRELNYKNNSEVKKSSENVVKTQKKVKKEKKRPIQKKKPTFSEGIKCMMKNKVLLQMCFIVISYSICTNLIDTVFKATMKASALKNNTSISSTVMKTQAINQMVISSCVIILLSTPFSRIIQTLGWRFAGFITPIWAISCCFLVLFLSIYNTAVDNVNNSKFLNSMFRDRQSFLGYEKVFGMLAAGGLKTCKYAAFDIAIEALSMRLEKEGRSSAKGIYAGICGKLGKSGGSVMTIVILGISNAVDLRCASQYVFVIVFVFCAMWMYAVTYLGRKYNESVESKTEIQIMDVQDSKKEKLKKIK